MWGTFELSHSPPTSVKCSKVNELISLPQRFEKQDLPKQGCKVSLGVIFPSSTSSSTAHWCVSIFVCFNPV